MKPRIAGISLFLCLCLLSAPSIRATEPSPFALPPETEQPQPQTTPTTSQPAQPAPATSPATNSSSFDLPTAEQPPAKTTAVDPDTAFDLPATGQAPVTTPSSGLPGPQATSPTATPTNQPAAGLLAQGTELARQGKYEEARIALESAMLKEPGNVLILNNLGLVMRKLGRLDEATRAYTAAMDRDPGFALTYKNYGILLEQNGEKRRAVDAYRRYCSLAPNAPDVQKVSQRADWLAGGL